MAIDDFAYQIANDPSMLRWADAIVLWFVYFVRLVILDQDGQGRRLYLSASPRKRTITIPGQN